MVNPGICPPPPDRRYNHPHPARYPHPYIPVDYRRAGSGHSSPFEPHRTMSSEDISAQRKRIPVACGRCRKRKIRCSGDTGDGSCSNCRNAGALPCQFLRVASQETAFKPEPGFNYNLADSRTHHARGMTNVSTTQPMPTAYPDGVPVDVLPYKSSHTYGYSSGPVGRTPLPWGSAYYDTVADQDTGYQSHSLYIPTYPPQESRYAPPYQPPSTKALPPYVDTESTAYGFGSGSYGTSSLAHRPAPSAADAGSTSWLHSIPGSSMVDKTTAMPTIDRPGLQPQSYVRNDSISSAAYSKSSSSPTGSLPEMTPSASSYGTTSYESSPVSGYPTAGSSTQKHRSGDYWAISTSAASNSSSISLDCPPPPVSKPYTYQDTTAAAMATAAAHRQRANISSPYVPSTYDLTLPEDRKDPVSLRS